jgi:hypothetical protein
MQQGQAHQAKTQQGYLLRNAFKKTLFHTFTPLAEGGGAASASVIIVYHLGTKAGGNNRIAGNYLEKLFFHTRRGARKQHLKISCGFGLLVSDNA